MNIHRLSRPIFSALICLSLVFVSDDVRANKYQSLESIQLQAEEYIIQFDYKTPYLPEFKTSYLNSRLKLANCNKPLHIAFSNLQKTYGRTSLDISCRNSPKWRIHLPIKVDVYDDVLITKHPFSLGQKIGIWMLEYKKRNISLLNQGYFTQFNDLKNRESRRNLRRGSILTLNNTRLSEMVKSGQHVTLVLNYKGINIRTSGKALQSARIGQPVKVRNSQSQKIIEGIVDGEGLVKVNF